MPTVFSNFKMDESCRFSGSRFYNIGLQKFNDIWLSYRVYVFCSVGMCPVLGICICTIGKLYCNVMPFREKSGSEKILHCVSVLRADCLAVMVFGDMNAENGAFTKKVSGSVFLYDYRLYCVSACQ